MAKRVGRKTSGGKRHLSAAHRKAISDGLKRHHKGGAAPRTTKATSRAKPSLWDQQLQDKAHMDRTVLGNSGKGAVKAALKFAGRSALRMARAKLTGARWGK